MHLYAPDLVSFGNSQLPIASQSYVTTLHLGTISCNSQIDSRTYWLIPRIFLIANSEVSIAVLLSPDLFPVKVVERFATKVAPSPGDFSVHLNAGDSVSLLEKEAFGSTNVSNNFTFNLGPWPWAGSV